ncbi:MAG: uncharacterized protein KVP18_004825 [Porospora cf. gigantea A]|uniref:uncharacterized protein n=1 Tax=Porospora cf. gigantea A TaxID=2853593 RepID=UPI0035594920|nr:MAG: hypothetical protein KVP18_004825 [Porospora cf. gigantea A]
MPFSLPLCGSESVARHFAEAAAIEEVISFPDKANIVTSLRISPCGSYLAVLSQKALVIMSTNELRVPLARSVRTLESVESAGFNVDVFWTADSGSLFVTTASRYMVCFYRLDSTKGESSTRGLAAYMPSIFGFRDSTSSPVKPLTPWVPDNSAAIGTWVDCQLKVNSWPLALHFEMVLQYPLPISCCAASSTLQMFGSADGPLLIFVQPKDVTQVTNVTRLADLLIGGVPLSETTYNLGDPICPRTSSGMRVSNLCSYVKRQVERPPGTSKTSRNVNLAVSQVCISLVWSLVVIVLKNGACMTFPWDIPSTVVFGGLKVRDDEGLTQRENPTDMPMGFFLANDVTQAAISYNRLACVLASSAGHIDVIDFSDVLSYQDGKLIFNAIRRRTESSGTSPVKSLSFCPFSPDDSELAVVSRDQELLEIINIGTGLKFVYEGASESRTRPGCIVRLASWTSQGVVFIPEQSSSEELRFLNFYSCAHVNGYRRDLSYHVQQTVSCILVWRLDQTEKQFVTPRSIWLPARAGANPPMWLPLSQLHMSPNETYLAAVCPTGIGFYSLHRHKWAVMHILDQPPRVMHDLPMGWVTDQLFVMTASHRTAVKCAVCGSTGKEALCWLCSPNSLVFEPNYPRLGARKKAGAYRNLLKKDAKANCPRLYSVFFCDVKRVASPPISHIDGLLHRPILFLSFSPIKDAWIRGSSMVNTSRKRNSSQVVVIFFAIYDSAFMLSIFKIVFRSGVLVENNVFVAVDLSLLHWATHPTEMRFIGTYAHILVRHHSGHVTFLHLSTDSDSSPNVSESSVFFKPCVLRFWSDQDVQLSRFIPAPNFLKSLDVDPFSDDLPTSEASPGVMRTTSSFLSLNLDAADNRSDGSKPSTSRTDDLSGDWTPSKYFCEADPRLTAFGEAAANQAGELNRSFENTEELTFEMRNGTYALRFTRGRHVIIETEEGLYLLTVSCHRLSNNHNRYVYRQCLLSDQPDSVVRLSASCGIYVACISNQERLSNVSIYQPLGVTRVLCSRFILAWLDTVVPLPDGVQLEPHTSVSSIVLMLVLRDLCSKGAPMETILENTLQLAVENGVDGFRESIKDLRDSSQEIQRETIVQGFSTDRRPDADDYITIWGEVPILLHAARTKPSFKTLHLLLSFLKSMPISFVGNILTKVVRLVEPTVSAYFCYLMAGVHPVELFWHSWRENNLSGSAMILVILQQLTGPLDVGLVGLKISG